MEEKFLHLLRCPETGRKLWLEKVFEENGKVKEGILIEPLSGYKYPIINFIPRFVKNDGYDYSENFALEWVKHGVIQYDSVSGYPICEKRFYNETKWNKSLKGELILEAGCGAGRFTEHALNTGATVVSFDLSPGVEINYRFNGKNKNLLIIQADIYRLPFEKETFNKIFCFGILQYTPSPQKALISITEYLKPGGEIVSDIYLKNLPNQLSPRHIIRFITKRMSAQKLYFFTKRYIDIMWPLAKLIRKIPRIAHSINWIFLLADYSRLLPGAKEDIIKEWAYLDTFNILSSRYESMATIKSFTKIHEKAGLTGIRVNYGYNGIEGRGRKPETEKIQSPESKTNPEF